MDVNGPPPDLDLSPRTGPDDGRPTRSRRSPARAWITGLVIVGLLGAIGVVLFKQLDGASLYYYNVDEAVAQRSDIGDRRIRIQGTVVGQPDEMADEAVAFTVAFNGESVDVLYSGKEPLPDLFGTGTPSVMEGSFTPDGDFRSDRIVIKHTEDYKENNSDRVAPEDP